MCLGCDIAPIQFQGMLETEVLVEAIGAAEGGLIALYCTMPIETVQKTQIAEKSKGHDKHSFGDVAAKISSESGVLGFYRGIGVLSSMVASEKFIYYLVYTLLKKTIESNKPGSISLPVTICLGYLADLGRLPVTMPLDLLSTRMQTSSKGSLLQVAREILRTKGFSGFYEGWRAYLGLAVKPALQAASRTFDRHDHHHRSHHHSAAPSCACVALPASIAVALAVAARRFLTPLLLADPRLRAAEAAAQPAARAARGRVAAVRGGVRRRRHCAAARHAVLLPLLPRARVGAGRRAWRHPQGEEEEEGDERREKMHVDAC